VGDGTARQIRRLRAEGVEVTDSGRLSVERYRWRP
jgi:alkylated DNA nucleotide flippase Atl1